MKKVLQPFVMVLVLVGIVGCQSILQTDRPSQTETPVPTILGTVTPFTFHTITPKPVKISRFEECVAAGYRMRSTYPRQCIASNGEIFIEALDEELSFSRTYLTSGSGRFITSTRDRGTLIAGASVTGCWILKLDAVGEKEWESDFDQELSEELELPSDARFWCQLARETHDGGYAAMGVAYDSNFGQYRRSFIVTLDHEGNLLSGQLISKKGEKTPHLDRDGNLMWLTSLGIERKVIDNVDGGYLTVGKHEQSIPDSSTHMIKTDKNGDYVWDKNLCRDKNIQQAVEKAIVCSYNEIWDVIELQDGSFAVLGSSWLLKTDSKGNIEWIQSYLGTGNGHAILPMPDGGFLIAGEKYVDQKKLDGVLIKTDSTGRLQWTRTFGREKDDMFFGMEQRTNGEITVMGSFGAGTYLWLLGIDNAILKENAE